MRDLAGSVLATWLLLCFYVISASIIIPDEEYNALKDVYTYAGGTRWKYKTAKGTWDFSSKAKATPCSWEGITCNTTENDNVYHILSVKLSSYGLTGFLNRSIANLGYVEMMDLSHNSLRSSLPSFRKMGNLGVLFLQGNQFSGTLDNLFNSSSNDKVKIIDVSDNQLTGTIPGEIFKLPSLEILAASINCFTPMLPIAALCGSNTLKTLSLNGMKTAESCRLSFPGVPLKSVYPLYDEVAGLDKCFFNMTSLSTLQLSGNAVTGTLTGVRVVSKKLKNLVLSHNSIQGAIPLVFQLHGFSELDLSFNKFTGILDSHFRVWKNSSISLNNNRLSGYIPHSLVHLHHIEVLAGNLFACQAGQADLPSHDHHSGHYNCGSDDFNTSMYLWVGLLILGLAFASLAVLANRFYSTLRESAYEWIRASGKLFLELYELYLPNLNVTSIVETYPNYNLEKLEQHMQLVYFLKLNICYVVGFLCVLMLIFGLLTLSFNTHTYQYAYSVSMSFIQGQTPAVVLFVLAFVFAGTAGFWYREQILQNEFDITFSGDHYVKSKDDNIEMYQVARYRSNIIFMLLVIVCNGFVACLVNGAFVLMHDSLDNASIQALDVAVAAFKEYWSNYAIRAIVRRLFRNVIYIERDLDQPIVWKKYKVRIASIDGFNLTSTFIQKETKVIQKFLFGLSLFNNIVAPFVVIGLVSSLCFYNVIHEPPNIDSSYAYDSCEQYNKMGQCIATVPASTATIFPPPFTYSYKCSAALMYFYAAVYIYLCIFIGFITPLFEWLCFMLTTFWLDKKYVRAHSWLIARLSIMLRPIRQLHEERRASLKMSLMQRQQHQHDDDGMIFDKEEYCAEVMNILSLTLTLGLVNPPCGVIMCTTLLIYVLFNEWKIRYFVNAVCMYDANNEESCDYLLSKLNMDVSNLNYIFGNLVWITIPLVVSFYAMFVFDIYGDEVGLLKSIWAPITLMVSSFALYLSRDLFKYLGRSSYRVQSSESFRVAVKQTSTLGKQTSTLARQASQQIGLSHWSEKRSSHDDYYDSNYRFPDFSAKSTQMTENPMLALSKGNPKSNDSLTSYNSSHSIARESDTSRNSHASTREHQHGASIAQQFAPKNNVIDIMAQKKSRAAPEVKPNDA